MIEEHEEDKKDLIVELKKGKLVAHKKDTGYRVVCRCHFGCNPLPLFGPFIPETDNPNSVRPVTYNECHQYREAYYEALDHDGSSVEIENVNLEGD